MNKLPIVKRDIFSSITVDMSEPGWAADMGRRLESDNPIIIEYLRTVNTVIGSEATLVGLLVYRMLESQIEADNLMELLE